MDALVPWLPHVNASLNSLAAVLLVVGLILIKQRREIAHRNVMLSAFGVSTVFLLSYLLYHFTVGSVKFPAYPPAAIRILYYSILISHIFLAVSVPVLALLTIYFGYTNQRKRHIAVAKWCFPIWLYVSVTGVVVYLMLYHFYPPEPPKL